MKVILDIPSYEFDQDIANKFQDYFERVKADIADGTLCGNYELETTEMFLASFKRMQILPDNTTNGDLEKAILNPYKVCEYEYSVHVYMTEEDFWKADYQMNCNTRWWNTPYKQGNENDSNQR